MRTTYRAALVAAISTALAACSGGPRLGGDPHLRVLPAGELPVPQRADASTDAVPYYVGPLDRLTIDVFGVEELSGREVQVDASGRISFPLIGAIEAVGKTPGELEQELAGRLRLAHVRNPQVTVNLKETVSRTVTVDGTVAKPGLYPVAGRMSLIKTVATAQGTTEFSRVNEVVVFRTVANQRYAALYNLEAIRHGAYPDPEIYAGDVVMVGDDRSRRLFKDVLASVPALLSPIILLLR